MVRFPCRATTSTRQRLHNVLHVLYLIFNEGYTASSGCSAARIWPVRAIRLTRRAHAARPDHSEITGLLALMLVTEARRPARTGPHGELVPLEAQEEASVKRGDDLAARLP